MADDETTDETTTDEAKDEAKDTEKSKESEKTAEDYRRELREYERNAKKASARKDRELEQLRKQVQEREDADKSEQEKAVEQARKEAADEEREKGQRELRAERLHSAIARLAAKDFADVDDAIALLDVDEDEIFDEDGKVETEAVKSALADLLERKPHLKADAGRPTGSSDAGKGGAGGGSIEEMSVDDHLKAIQRHKL